MYTRVSTFQFQSGKVDEVMDIVRTSVIPALTPYRVVCKGKPFQRRVFEMI